MIGGTARGIRFFNQPIMIWREPQWLPFLL